MFSDSECSNILQCFYLTYLYMNFLKHKMRIIVPDGQIMRYSESIPNNHIVLMLPQIKFKVLIVTHRLLSPPASSLQTHPVFHQHQPCGDTVQHRIWHIHRLRRPALEFLNNNFQAKINPKCLRKYRTKCCCSYPSIIMASRVVSPDSSGLPPAPTMWRHCSASHSLHPPTTASTALEFFNSNFQA